MKKAVKKRGRLEPVRLEINGNLSEDTLDFIVNHLNLEKSAIYFTSTPLKMSYVFSLADKLSQEKKRSYLTILLTPYIQKI